MITSFQMKAARALLGIDQRTLAELAGRLPDFDLVRRYHMDVLFKNKLAVTRT